MGIDLDIKEIQNCLIGEVKFKLAAARPRRSVAYREDYRD